MIVLLVVAPCNLAEIYRRFGDTCRLHYHRPSYNMFCLRSEDFCQYFVPATFKLCSCGKV